MKKLAKIQNNKIISVFEGIDINYAKSIGYQEYDIEKSDDGGWYLKEQVPQKPLEELKEEKIYELKNKRDLYLKDNNYNFSDNDLFNIVNLIGFTQEDKDKYLSFIKNDLKVKYDYFKDKINSAETNEELENLNIDFSISINDIIKPLM